MKKAFMMFFCLVAVSCTTVSENNSSNVNEIAAVGLDGRNFYKPAPSATPTRLDSNFFNTKKQYDINPSEENTVWLGRREAYRANYREAIEIFTGGIKRFPESFKLYRHRGHRYITVREFDKAIADLEKAAQLMPKDSLEIEPDGQPNKLNIPLSSAQFNIWYHLALAYYLKGDFQKAEDTYLKCLAVSNNDDLLCATTDWLYMTYKRQGKDNEAAAILNKITDNMNIIENDSYYKRLMMYKGKQTPESLLEVEPGNDDPDLAIATQGYGVGNWYLCHGDTAQAKEIFSKVVSGKHFSAFGFIAAEAELAKLQ